MSAGTIAEIMVPDAPESNRVLRKPPGTARHFSSHPPFIEMVQERITRDWLRGVTELHLSKMYRVRREAIEQTVRLQVARRDLAA